MSEDRIIPEDQVTSCAAPRRNSVIGRRQLVLMSVAALAFSGITYAFGYLPGARGGVGSGWAAVEAVVLESGVYQETRSEPWGNSMREYTAYTPKARFKYKVGGTEYTGDEITRPAPAFRKEADAARMIADLMPGATAQARVNPDNPDEAVLIAGVVSAESTAFWAGSIVLLVMGVLGLLGARFLLA